MPRDDAKTPAKKKSSRRSPSAVAAKSGHEQAPPPEKVAETPRKEVRREPNLNAIRIRLTAFDHHVLDEAAAKIIDNAERSGAVIHGPIPLPTNIRKFTVNKSTFVHKNARDQYEMRTHRRLIDLTETTFKTVESLQGLSLPSGVDIEIQMR